MRCLMASQERRSQLSIAREAWNMVEYVASNRVEPVAVKPRPNHRIWVRFADGIEGKIDLSRWVRRRSIQGVGQYSPL